MADAESQARPSATRLDENEVDLADDLLWGAGAIADCLYDDRTKRRQVYHLAQKGCLPFFKIGGMLCARRSRLRARIEELEIEAMQEEG